MVTAPAAEPTPLVVTEARLRSGAVVDVHCAGGRVTALAPPGQAAPPPGAVVVSADGGLVTEPFVDAHLHLDKVRTLPLIGDTALEAYTADGMADSARGIDLARAVKAHYAVDTLLPSIREALADGVHNGVLHVQAFADVDTAAGLTGVQAVLAGREEFRGRVDVSVVAFPQDGVLRDPGAAELVEEAMAQGADVVGGIPWIEATTADQEAHVEWACALAARLGRRVAMLTDDAPDPAYDTTRMLAEAMHRHGLDGRGVACHARAVGHYEEQRQDALLDLAREVGLGLVSDPHTGSVALPVERALARASRSPWARTTSRTRTTRSAGTTCWRSRSWPRTCWTCVPRRSRRCWWTSSPRLPPGCWGCRTMDSGRVARPTFWCTTPHGRSTCWAATRRRRAVIRRGRVLG